MSYQHWTRFWTTVDFDCEYLCNRSSNRQAVNGVINYDFFHVRRKRFGELWSTYEKNDLDRWPMTLKLNRVCALVKIHVHAKYHQAMCSGSWVIVLTTFFALSRNSEKSENPVLWPWPLIYDLEILWVSCGCQATCSCKIRPSEVQRFMNYRGHREKKTRTKTLQSATPRGQ